MYLATFTGGIVAAHLARIPKFCAVARHHLSAVPVILLIIGCLALFRGVYTALPMALLSVAFIFIAAGNTLFGALAWKGSRLIGEVTYSVYLLHGIVLFWVFDGIVRSEGTTFPAAEHWAIVLGCIPVVLGISCATFRFIERPAMDSVPKIMSWIERLRLMSAGPQRPAENASAVAVKPLAGE